MFNRFCTFVSIAAVISLILLIGLYQTPWSSHRRPHLSDYLTTLQHDDDLADNETTTIAPNEPVLNTTHPQTTLVLATLSSTDNTWIETELSDLLGTAGNLYTAVYVVNDETAPLHTPKNKGHEAMAYLTYIIDFYDTLPEISIFMHGHPTAWHNNYLLSMSSSQMIRHLSREKVLRDGYMNLRCHWSPGCPSHLHPQATEYDDSKREELVIKDAWAAMFPLDPLPESLSQPCCSQFATTRDAIHRHPLSKYKLFRDWLLESDLTDYVTGRIFEYFWQYIFAEETEHCPDPRICYCDGYGICFEDPNGYMEFFDLVTELDKLRKEEDAWETFKSGKLISRRAEDEGREEWLARRIMQIEEELEERKAVSMDDLVGELDDLKKEEAAWDLYHHGSLFSISRREVDGRDESKKEQDLRELYGGGLLIDRTEVEERDDNHDDGPDPVVDGTESREAWLRQRIEDVEEDLTRRKEAAFEVGRDPSRRAAAIAAARNQTLSNPKDGPPFWTHRV